MVLTLLLTYTHYFPIHLREAEDDLLLLLTSTYYVEYLRKAEDEHE